MQRQRLALIAILQVGVDGQTAFPPAMGFLSSPPPPLSPPLPVQPPSPPPRLPPFVPLDYYVLELDEDVTEQQFQTQAIGFLIVKPGCNVIGAESFEQASIGSVTIEYHNGTLLFDEYSFRDVNHEPASGTLTITRLCHVPACTVQVDSCYRAVSNPSQAFQGVEMTLIDGTCVIDAPSSPPPKSPTPAPFMSWTH